MFVLRVPEELDLYVFVGKYPPTGRTEHVRYLHRSDKADSIKVQADSLLFTAQKSVFIKAHRYDSRNCNLWLCEFERLLLVISTIDGTSEQRVTSDNRLQN